MTREQALADLGLMINMQSVAKDPAHFTNQVGFIDICLEEADRRLHTAEGTADRAAWRQLDTIRDVLLWETCTSCGKDYRYPHLCREHLLCGLCHPPQGIVSAE